MEEDLRFKIRELLEESLLVEEKKDHLISKSKLMTDSEKEFLIDLYNRRPDFEKKFRIDWNRPERLSFNDFKEAITIGSMTELKRLKENEDYIKVRGLNKIDGLIGAYIPLNYEASKLIASNKIGPCLGEWCTAYPETTKWWNRYTKNDGVVLIYFVYLDTKYALAIHRDNDKVEIFDKKDNSIDSIPGININSFISKNEEFINDVRKTLSGRDMQEEVDKVVNLMRIGLKRDIAKLVRTPFDVIPRRKIFESSSQVFVIMDTNTPYYIGDYTIESNLYISFNPLEYSDSDSDSIFASVEYSYSQNFMIDDELTGGPGNKITETINDIILDKNGMRGGSTSFTTSNIQGLFQFMNQYYSKVEDLKDYASGIKK
jgi:hypothetical protein